MESNDFCKSEGAQTRTEKLCRIDDAALRRYEVLGWPFVMATQDASPFSAAQWVYLHSWCETGVGNAVIGFMWSELASWVGGIEAIRIAENISPSPEYGRPKLREGIFAMVTLSRVCFKSSIDMPIAIALSRVSQFASRTYAGIARTTGQLVPV